MADLYKDDDTLQNNEKKNMKVNNTESQVRKEIKKKARKKRIKKTITWIIVLVIVGGGYYTYNFYNTNKRLPWQEESVNAPVEQSYIVSLVKANLSYSIFYFH